MTAIKGVYKNYNKELLAIIEMFKRWRHYLMAIKLLTEVLYDHDNLRYFMITIALNRRQVRWAFKLLKYDFKIKYHVEKSNPIDFLLRRPDFRALKEE